MTQAHPPAALRLLLLPGKRCWVVCRPRSFVRLAFWGARSILSFPPILMVRHYLPAALRLPLSVSPANRLIRTIPPIISTRTLPRRQTQPSLPSLIHPQRAIPLFVLLLARACRRLVLPPPATSMASATV